MRQLFDRLSRRGSWVQLAQEYTELGGDCRSSTPLTCELPWFGLTGSGCWAIDKPASLVAKPAGLKGGIDSRR